MGSVITTAVDALSKEEREDLYIKLLAYAGPPPVENSEYKGWSYAVEQGARVLYPKWDMVDLLDTTIRFRHRCSRFRKLERLMN